MTKDTLTLIFKDTSGKHIDYKKESKFIPRIGTKVLIGDTRFKVEDIVWDVDLDTVSIYIIQRY